MPLLQALTCQAFNFVKVVKVCSETYQYSCNEAQVRLLIQSLYVRKGSRHQRGMPKTIEVPLERERNVIVSTNQNTWFFMHLVSVLSSFRVISNADRPLLTSIPVVQERLCYSVISPRRCSGMLPIKTMPRVSAMLHESVTQSSMFCKALSITLNCSEAFCSHSW